MTSLLVFILGAGFSRAWALDLRPHWNMNLKPQGSVEDQVLDPRADKYGFNPKQIKINKPTLSDSIFNEKLTRDIKVKYEELFGPFEASYLSPTFPTLESLWNQEGALTFKEQLQARNLAMEEFGRFMARKTIESLLERALKEGPETQKIYEIKEKITNAQLSISEKVKIKILTSISGPSIDFQLVRGTLQMGYLYVFSTARKTISDHKERVQYTRIQIDKWDQLEVQNKEVDGVIAFIMRRSFSPQKSYYVSLSTNTHNHGDSIREILYLVGMNLKI